MSALDCEVEVGLSLFQTQDFLLVAVQLGFGLGQLPPQVLHSLGLQRCHTVGRGEVLDGVVSVQVVLAEISFCVGQVDSDGVAAVVLRLGLPIEPIEPVFRSSQSALHSSQLEVGVADILVEGIPLQPQSGGSVLELCEGSLDGVDVVVDGLDASLDAGQVLLSLGHSVLGLDVVGFGNGQKFFSLDDFFLGSILVGGGLLNDVQEIGEGFGSIELPFKDGGGLDVFDGDGVAVGVRRGGPTSGDCGKRRVECRSISSSW